MSTDHGYDQIGDAKGLVGSLPHVEYVLWQAINHRVRRALVGATGLTVLVCVIALLFLPPALSLVTLALIALCGVLTLEHRLWTRVPIALGRASRAYDWFVERQRAVITKGTDNRSASSQGMDGIVRGPDVSVDSRAYIRATAELLAGNLDTAKEALALSNATDDWERFLESFTTARVDIAAGGEPDLATLSESSRRLPSIEQRAAATLYLGFINAIRATKVERDGVPALAEAWATAKTIDPALGERRGYSRTR